MIHVEDDVRIDAPVEAVFEYMDVPENQAEITPSLSSVETVETLPSGGKRATYVYGMAGVGLDGEVRAVEYEPGERIVFEMTGDIEGEIRWSFEAEDGGTRVRYAADYGVPVPVLDRVVEPFVRRYNERELETTLRNLKTRMEATAEE